MMTKTSEDGLTILRLMAYELGLDADEEIQEAELLSHLHLDDASFRKAAMHLFYQQYLFTVINEGNWQLTGRGIQYVQYEMGMRLPLSLDAERVLRFCVEETKDRKNSILSKKIIEVLSIDEQRYKDAYRKLSSFDLVFEDPSYRRAIVTREGYKAVADNFRRPGTPNTQINTGAIIGEVSGGNVQAIANAYDSQIQQIINQSDVNVLRQEISEAIEKLVNEVSESLNLQQKADYLQIAYLDC